ncbi:ABC transporter permease [Streptomyces sp. NBRC 110028]|uniref:ABC transporter permease n=1 Tax=Streptomyces sp. NBRC 110028 TaxID=1621260 RepID=UPI0006E3093E|nr:ABC transporter permease [Streptomyces sp. NBRC 110028]
MRPSAASSLLPVNTTLAVLLVLLLLAATGAVALFRLSPDARTHRARQVLLAGVRAALQLAVVSTIIAWVVRSPLATVAFLVVMLGVAVRTAGRRLTTDGSWWVTLWPIGLSVLPVVSVLLLSGLVPPKGIVLIPVTGIFIGGALTATVLSGRRALDELNLRYGEFEAGLAVGMSDRDARMEIARPAASDALLPGLDQTRTVGLVTLPGAFVGMLLGGASPVAAGAVQLFVLVALMAIQAVAVACTVELIARGHLHRPKDHRR